MPIRSRKGVVFYNYLLL